MQNNNNPKVTICVPIYGVEKYIEKCARSLFEQTYSNIEYIFVDDCSPDNSIAELEKTIDEYPTRKEDIRIIRHDSNKGLAGSRNTAVAAAIGDFIAHVDSDDWLELNAIELLVNKQIETGADIVSGTMVSHFESETSTLIEPNYTDKAAMLREIVNLSLLHTLCKRIIRTSLYKDHNVMAVEGVNLGEDHYTLPRLVYYSSSFAKIDDVVYHYNRMTTTSLVHNSLNDFKIKNYTDTLSALQVLIDFFSEHDDWLLPQLRKIRLSYVFRIAHDSIARHSPYIRTIQKDLHIYKKENKKLYFKLCFFEFLKKIKVLDYLVTIKKSVIRKLKH